jgi:hypothetical protein
MREYQDIGGFEDVVKTHKNRGLIYTKVEDLKIWRSVLLRDARRAGDTRIPRCREMRMRRSLAGS